MVGGLAIALGVALLGQGRVRGCLAACALQGWAVGIGVAWRGWAAGDGWAELAGVAALAANGMLLPLALARAGRGTERHRAARGVAPVVAGLLAVALAVSAVRSLPLAAAGGVLAREDLAAVLSVTLLGLLAMAARREALVQAAGFIAAGNGLVMALSGVPGTTPVLAAALALEGAVVAGAMLRQRGEHLAG